MFSLKNIFIIFLSIIMLSACNGDPCIDADDFGFPKVYVSSRYPDPANITDSANQNINFNYEEK